MNLRITVWASVLLVCPGPVLAATQTLLLDGATERVVVQHDPALSPSSGITIEAWIRPTTVSGCQTIVGKGYQTAYWLGICSGIIRYYSNGLGTHADGNAAVTVGAWWHIAVTFDGTTRRYYINGELDFSAATAGPLGANGQALGIGGEGASSTFPSDLFPFSGRISEVRLWNYSRSQAQIRGAMYQQITSPQPGLITVWALEGGADDRFGLFNSVLAPGAGFSSLDSPPVPHDPLRIRNASFIVADGDCGDAGYTSATVVPAWYESTDRPLSERNPQEILLGASAIYLYVCLPNRSQLNDPIYAVQIDTENHGTSALQSDDYDFSFWPGGTGLTTRVGQTVGIFSSWVQTTNPSGLSAAETSGVEFVTDFEMRIPRSVFTDPSGIFRIRVDHNFLVAGGAERSVAWPEGSAGNNPASWQEATVDLSSVGPPDSRNPSVSSSIENDRPRFLENVRIEMTGDDDTDVELVELLVDGSVVEAWDFLGAADRSFSVVHEALYPPGNHTYQARVFDQAGRVGHSPFQSFRVLVDGEPPRVSLSVDPLTPAVGQAVTLTARASDASGVSSIQIRDVLGFLSPSFKRCDFPSGGGVELCTWTVTPDPRVARLRVDAVATDSEGFSDDTGDQVILFGNSGPDTDGDGLSDRIEAGLCTYAETPDSDGDGLSDGWEVTGIRFAGGGLEPLVDYSVNPCWKNVLLQLDYETGAMPPAAGLDNLRNRYREQGITVYLEINERPRPTAYDQSHLAAQTGAYQMDGGEYYFHPRRTWAFYYGYERNLSGRSGASNRFFTIDHYFQRDGFCFGGDRAGGGCRGDFDCPGGGTCGAGCNSGTNAGMACTAHSDCPKDDGSFSFCSVPCVTDPAAAGPRCSVINDLPYRLFHEFGHTVGLGHGGRTGTRAPTVNGGFVTRDNQWDEANNKPNHQSAMNYGYNQGAICLEPFPSPIPDGFGPTLVGQITYMTNTLGDLDENLLSEGPLGGFAENLRARDCSFASATAFPAFKYTCKFGDTQYEVISDGLATLARRPRAGEWDFSPPSHAPGIDWNCNSMIDASPVAENINGPGWDEGILESNLRGREEFPAIPNPVVCQNIYSAKCTDPTLPRLAARANSCYRWPAAYQNAIPGLATGVDPIDCRDVFLANREGDCAGGSDSEFGTGVCPQVDRDTPLTSALSEKQWGGFDDFAPRGLPPGFDSDHTDNDDVRPLPGMEQCDLADNDGDGAIDEGCADTDGDGVPDAVDNCATVANADQADRDGDGLGEACQFPTISNLMATWDGDRTVNLIWDDDGIPLRGVVVYRYGVTDPDPLYRGDLYPSAIGNAYADSVGWGDAFTYVVRPVNLNGEEGEPVAAMAVVDIANLIFGDSFEAP